LTDHATVQAVFIREKWSVKVFTDNATPQNGTLRYAIANAEDGDIISVEVEDLEDAVITLVAPLTVAKSITLEGNGVTLTPASAYAATNGGLMYVTGEDVKITQVWFKDGAVGTTGQVRGGAISGNGNKLTLESCIFTGNKATTDGTIALGGAIYYDNGADGDLIIKGCTFYNNKAISGAAIYIGIATNQSNNLTLYGNLFYENTSTSISTNFPVVSVSNTTAVTSGYNIVDVDFGITATECGWVAGLNDITIAELFDPDELDNTIWPFFDEDDEDDLAPATGLASFIGEAWAAENMPATDFYGNDRDWGAPGAIEGSD
jgi:hypothetical protein